ncbi:hypothetical protein Hanom_Chr10g00935851 [Helianthus anomalus]
MCFYVLIWVELNKFKKSVFCRLNTKIVRIVGNANGMEMKVLEDDIIECSNTKTWPQTEEKMELK